MTVESILALCARRIASDWLEVYHHPLYLLETFVEKDPFDVIATTRLPSWGKCAAF